MALTELQGQHLRKSLRFYTSRPAASRPSALVYALDARQTGTSLQEANVKATPEFGHVNLSLIALYLSDALIMGASGSAETQFREVEKTAARVMATALRTHARETDTKRRSLFFLNSRRLTLRRTAAQDRRNASLLNPLEPTARPRVRALR